MTDATVFVAIAIGCVVALLLLTASFVYCIKKHHNKQQQRHVVERQAREERYRRHLMRTQVVRPPPYDAQRQNVLEIQAVPVPFTPPPVYKERATPHPGTDRQDLSVGLGSTPITPAPSYGSVNPQIQISTISRNVAPNNTNYNTQPPHVDNQPRHNISVVVREAPNNRTNNSNEENHNTNNNNNNSDNNDRNNGMNSRNNARNRRSHGASVHQSAPIYVIGSSRIPPPPDPPSYSSANRREDSIVDSNSSHVARENATLPNSSESSSPTNTSYRSNVLHTDRSDGYSGRGRARETSSVDTSSQSLPPSNRSHTHRSANDRSRDFSSSRSHAERPSEATSRAASSALQDLSLI